MSFVVPSVVPLPVPLVIPCGLTDGTLRGLFRWLQDLILPQLTGRQGSLRFTPRSLAASPWRLNFGGRVFPLVTLASPVHGASLHTTVPPGGCSQGYHPGDPAAPTAGRRPREYSLGSRHLPKAAFRHAAEGKLPPRDAERLIPTTPPAAGMNSMLFRDSFGSSMPVWILCPQKNASVLKAGNIFHSPFLHEQQGQLQIARRSDGPWRERQNVYECFQGWKRVRQSSDRPHLQVQGRIRIDTDVFGR